MKHPCKGTVLKIEVATVLTAVAQIVSIDVGDKKPETYDASTLDQAAAGKAKELTGYSTAGDVSGELFFDPGNAGHAAMYASADAPAKLDGQVAFTDDDTSPSVLDFTACGVAMGLAVKMNDGLKAKFTMEQDGLPVLTPAA